MAPAKDDVDPRERRGASEQQGRAHKIALADLIVHRHSEQDALFKKADKLARSIIDEELRDGEALRYVAPGSYTLLFPRLTPAAGALRCSVIGERIAREIRRLNPTSVEMDRDKEGPASASQSAAKSATSAVLQGKMSGGDRAFARMAEAKGGSDEGLIPPADLAILNALSLAFHPVWHTKNRLITGYYCVPSHDGREVSARVMSAAYDEPVATAVRVKIDTFVYAQAWKALQHLMANRQKALLILPLHFSTVDRLRHMGTFLGAADLSEEAKPLIVFELMDLPPAVTRFRLREPVNYLRGRSRALIARVGFGKADLDMLKELGFHGISVNTADYAYPEGRFFKDFEQMAGAAEEARLQSFVHGIASTSLVVGAVGAGITYMDGSAIAEPVHGPDHMRPFEIDMLYNSSGAS